MSLGGIDRCTGKKSEDGSPNGLDIYRWSDRSLSLSEMRRDCCLVSCPSPFH